MRNKFGIAYCTNLQLEIEGAITAEMREKTILKPYDSHNDVVSIGRTSSNEAVLVLSSDCDSICLFGCGCPSALNIPAFTDQTPAKVCLRKGAELFLPSNTVQQLHRQGSYIVVAGWVNEWKENLQCHFPDLDVARQLFSESIKEIVLLDTGMYPNIGTAFMEFTGLLQIPGRTLEVGVDRLNLLIENRFLDWKLSQEQKKYEFSIREAGKKLADNIMVSDFLGDIARLQDERKLILKIEEIYALLMSPQSFSYHPHPFDDDPEWLRIRDEYDTPKEDFSELGDYRVNRKGDGFISPVLFQDEMLGIIHVDGLAFPKYLNEYLNTSRFVARVFALALHNSSIYRKLKDTISELDSEVIARHRVQESLEVANKKLNLLSSITRHDMNNYLAVQLGYLELLDRRNMGSKVLDYLTKIENAAEQMATMIRFTKEYEEIGMESAQWHNVRNFVNTAADMLKLGNVSIENEIPSELEIFSDRLIGKVFYNLIENALRYGGRITTIKFSLKHDDGHFAIVCEDDGFGIQDEDKERIFNRGFGKNTGLGLFLSKEVLSITGLSINEVGVFGQGARFKIHVPESACRGA